MALVHASSVASMVSQVHCLVGCWIAYLSAVVVVVVVVVVVDVGGAVVVVRPAGKGNIRENTR